MAEGFFVKKTGLGRTETEYAGTVPSENTMQPKERPDGELRELSPSEKLRLQRLTGQDEETNAPRKSGFMYGVDPDFPEHPDMEEW